MYGVHLRRVSGGEGRRELRIERNGRARKPEVLRTVESGIFYLSRLRKKGGKLRGYQEMREEGGKV